MIILYNKEDSLSIEKLQKVTKKHKKILFDFRDYNSPLK